MSDRVGTSQTVGGLANTDLPVRLDKSLGQDAKAEFRQLLQPNSPHSLVEQAPVEGEQLREAFQDFVGQTFFSQMMKSMRSAQQPSAYFHGGRTEEIFQSQLDQVFSEEMSDSSAEQIADPMFELFMLKRQ